MHIRQVDHQGENIDETQQQYRKNCLALDLFPEHRQVDANERGNKMQHSKNAKSLVPL